MIRLKNGFEINYNKDFDLFFRNLLESIVQESKLAAKEVYQKTDSDESLNDLFLKELMDNCIYVTHQLFEISKTNEDFSKFMVTGFIFNSIILSLPQLDFEFKPKNEKDKGVIH